MPLGPRRTSRPIRSQRRKLVWATTDTNVSLGLPGQISNVNLLSALSVAGASLLGVTIIRTHLVFTILTNAAANDLLRLGLIVGRTSDVGVNVAGQQDPANPELDWMLLQRRVILGQGSNVSPKPEFVYNLKAKRKMQELNQAYILAWTTSSASATTAQVFARTLIALPL